MKDHLKTELRSFHWEGNRRIVVRQRVIDGPKSALDRVVILRLSFREIRELVEQMEIAEYNIGAQEAKLKAVNARNSGEE